MRRGQRYYHFRYKGANRMCRCCPFQMLANSRNVIHPLIDDRHSAIFIAGKTSVREKANEA